MQDGAKCLSLILSTVVLRSKFGQSTTVEKLDNKGFEAHKCNPHGSPVLLYYNMTQCHDNKVLMYADSPAWMCY